MIVPTLDKQFAVWNGSLYSVCVEPVDRVRHGYFIVICPRMIQPHGLSVVGPMVSVELAAGSEGCQLVDGMLSHGESRPLADWLMEQDDSDCQTIGNAIAFGRPATGEGEDWNLVPGDLRVTAGNLTRPEYKVLRAALQGIAPCLNIRVDAWHDRQTRCEAALIYWADELEAVAAINPTLLIARLGEVLSERLASPVAWSSPILLRPRSNYVAD